MRSSGSGVACPSGNAAASAASARSRAAASPAPDADASWPTAQTGSRVGSGRPATSGARCRPAPRSSTRRRAGSTAGSRPSSGRGRGAGRARRARPSRRRCCSRRASSRTCRHASSTPVRSRSTRFIETCGRPSDSQHEAERAHAREPAVAFADLARDAARDRDVAAHEHAVDRDERLARADRGRAERRVRCRRDRSRARGCGSASSRACAEDRARRDRRRRRRTPAPRGSRPTTRRTRAPSSAACARSAFVPPSATNGTTSSAPRHGCTPSCSAIEHVLGDRGGEVARAVDRVVRARARRA